MTSEELREGVMPSAASCLACLLIAMTALWCECGGLQLYEGDDCLDKCPVTISYFPVCGTDYVTYTNPTSLRCWKKCKNPSLGVAHFSTCVDWISGDYKSWENVKIRFE